MTNGDLYTIVTNKAAKGQKGAIVAMIEGTKSEDVIKVLKKIPQELRETVKEITLDMAGAMSKIAKSCFPKAQRVIDRFHVQKLAYDAMQEIRIAYRWVAIEEEANASKEHKELANKAKEYGEKISKFEPKRYANGDTDKQLLARSRYLLFKPMNKLTLKQRERAAILFAEYPEIKNAYDLTHKLRMIFSQTKDKTLARTKLAHWYKEAEELNYNSFNSIIKTLYQHNQEVLNFFDNRSTNASAESFNAKIKAFRSQLRGVSDIDFFLYRLTKIYA